MIRLNTGLTIANTDFTLAVTHEAPASVVISVPHDGMLANDLTGHFARRAVGIHGRDAYVWPIVNDVVCASLEQGCRVDAIRLLMPRAYIDGNRALRKEDSCDADVGAQTALDDEMLLAVYEKYHNLIAQSLERAITAYGEGRVLFLDVHGFRRQPAFASARGYDVILGTANRRTIRANAHVDQALAEHLGRAGYHVFLPTEVPVVPEGDPYSAGHTTCWYARHYGINAIQIEVRDSFRQRDDGERGFALAQSLAQFFALHYST